MELCIACHLLPFGGRRAVDFLYQLGSPRNFRPPLITWRWMQQQNDLKVNFRASNLSASTSMSTIDDIGYSVIACRGVRKVLWNIEADVTDGYLLFITGDPISLGSWEVERAIHLSHCKEHANLFISEIKVPCGIHFKYNYFMKDEKNSLRDIVWRSGPELSLSIPSIGSENEVIVVRDCWMRNRIQGLSVPSWGSWMLDVEFPNNQIKNGNYKVSPAVNSQESWA